MYDNVINDKYKRNYIGLNVAKEDLVKQYLSVLKNRRIINKVILEEKETNYINYTFRINDYLSFRNKVCFIKWIKDNFIEIFSLSLMIRSI